MYIAIVMCPKTVQLREQIKNGRGEKYHTNTFVHKCTAKENFAKEKKIINSVTAVASNEFIKFYRRRK